MESISSPEELIDTLPERNITSPVFESMHVIQQNIADTFLSEAEIVDAWKISQKILSEINARVKEEGLVGKEVELAGSELKVPDVKTDLASAALMSTIRDAPLFQANSLNEYHDAHEIHGAFTGFTFDFIKRENGLYQPTLAYQVGFAMHATPHLTMTIHATGPITSSRLTFAEDERKDTSTDLALSLLEECGREFWPSIRLIRDASVIDESIDASRLRHLAYHAEKIVNRQKYEKLPHIERKLADMVSLAIPRALKADILVDKALQLHENERVVHTGDVSLVAPVSSVIFQDEFHSVEDTAELTGRRVLCLVSDTKDNGLIYIPALGVSKMSSV